MTRWILWYPAIYCSNASLAVLSLHFCLWLKCWKFPFKVRNQKCYPSFRCAVLLLWW